MTSSACEDGRIGADLLNITLTYRPGTVDVGRARDHVRRASISDLLADMTAEGVLDMVTALTGADDVDTADITDEAARLDDEDIRRYLTHIVDRVERVVWSRLTTEHDVGGASLIVDAQAPWRDTAEGAEAIYDAWAVAPSALRAAGFITVQEIDAYDLLVPALRERGLSAEKAVQAAAIARAADLVHTPLKGQSLLEAVHDLVGSGPAASRRSRAIDPSGTMSLFSRAGDTDGVEDGD